MLKLTLKRKKVRKVGNQSHSFIQNFVFVELNYSSVKPNKPLPSPFNSHYKKS